MASDHYATLRIRSHATEDEIRDAYLRCARQCHPDLNSQDPAAEKQFKQIRLAYEILSNRHTRMQYDRNRTALDNTTVVYATGRCHSRPNMSSADAKAYGWQTRRPSSVRFDAIHRSSQSGSSRMWSLIAVAVCVGMILGGFAALAYQQRRAADWRLEVAKALRESSKQTAPGSADRIGHNASQLTTTLPRPTPPVVSSDAAVGTRRDVQESAPSNAQRDEKPPVRSQSDDLFRSNTPAVSPPDGGVFQDLGTLPDAVYGVSNESYTHLPIAGDGLPSSAIPPGALTSGFRRMTQATIPGRSGGDATSEFWPDSPVLRAMRTEVVTPSDSALFGVERDRHLDILVGASPITNPRMGVPYQSGPTSWGQVGGIRSPALSKPPNGTAWDNLGRRSPGHALQLASDGRFVWPSPRLVAFPAQNSPYGYTTPPTGTYSVARPGGVLSGVGNAPFAVGPGIRHYNSASAFSSGSGAATGIMPY